MLFLQVGSGDVNTAAAALRIRRETGCDAIMVGRGAVQDPFVFHRIRAAFADAGQPSVPLASGLAGADLLIDEAASMCRFLRAFARYVRMTSQVRRIFCLPRFERVFLALSLRSELA